MAGAVFMPKPPKYMPWRSGQKYTSASSEPPCQENISLAKVITATYGSGLLRYFQNAGLEVLEVTAPDRMERRKRGKSDN